MINSIFNLRQTGKEVEITCKLHYLELKTTIFLEILAHYTKEEVLRGCLRRWPQKM